MNTVHFNLSVDCEATQLAYDNVELGARSALGLAEVLEKNQWRGTFFTIPTEIEACGSIYKELTQRGHEIGLHLHPAAQGYEEFCGIYGPDLQGQIIGEAAERFAAVMGHWPRSFCMGYASANDYTYQVLAKLGFTHGTCSMPGRILPECASTWAGAPLFMHYAHRYNRMLAGDLDFVEMPRTTDLESKIWGGKTCLDLRIELVDAKNHFYTIEKSLKQQIDKKVPVKNIHAFTHNVFDFDKPSDFRRETLEGVIEHTKRIVADAGLELLGTTLEQTASEYRKLVKKETVQLNLDRRGHLNKE